MSSATLRRWSDTFTEYLSPSAGRSVSESGGAAQRRYSDDDLAVLSRVKQLLDAGNTYEETARKLPETPIGQLTPPAASAVAISEPLPSGSLIAVEAFREALAGKDQTIEALQQTIHFQNILLEELRRQRDTAPKPAAPALPSVTLPAMTFRQRLDWLLRGRMIGGQREERLADPEGLAQRPLPQPRASLARPPGIVKVSGGLSFG